MGITLKTVCICGGGSLGHVIAGFLSAKGKVKVNILTEHPLSWEKRITIYAPNNEILSGEISAISSDPALVVPQADVILLCLPGFLIRKELLKIKEWVTPGTYVGSVFSSTGFFFEAIELFDSSIPLWGFQRVPFISRVKEYGRSANLLGYKDGYNIAVEHLQEKDKDGFRAFIEEIFERPTTLLKNYWEASLTNSNPILHTARLYSMFHNWQQGFCYPRNILFYEEWSVEASELLIAMDEEFFRLLNTLPVSPNFLPRLLDYYESVDATSLTRKISSIAGFKGIYSPMKETEGGWIPDFSSRYFTEDFPYGLRYVWQLAHRNHVEVPVIDKVYEWGISRVDSCM